MFWPSSLSIHTSLYIHRTKISQLESEKKALAYEASRSKRMVGGGMVECYAVKNILLPKSETHIESFKL